MHVHNVHVYFAHTPHVHAIAGLLHPYYSPTHQANWSSGVPFEVCASAGCTATSHTDGWAAAAGATLQGDRLVLQLPPGLDPDAAVAVRTHWRIYPCEHLGCGLYSKESALPPPPFYARLR